MASPVSLPSNNRLLWATNVTGTVSNERLYESESPVYFQLATGTGVRMSEGRFDGLRIFSPRIPSFLTTRSSQANQLFAIMTGFEPILPMHSGSPPILHLREGDEALNSESMYSVGLRLSLMSYEASALIAVSSRVQDNISPVNDLRSSLEALGEFGAAHVDSSDGNYSFTLVTAVDDVRSGHEVLGEFGAAHVDSSDTVPPFTIVTAVDDLRSSQEALGEYGDAHVDSSDTVPLFTIITLN